MDGFAADLCIDGSRSLQFYYYHLDQEDEQLSAWLDGKLIGHVEKIRFRNSEKVKIQRLAVYSYFGGSDYEDASPKDQRIYVDNVVISRRPIGCLISALFP